MSKKKEPVTLRDALNKIQYPTEREAAIAVEIFGNWIRTKTETIWARDFAALARVEWPMELYNYGWPAETLFRELLNGYIDPHKDVQHNTWKIKVPDPIEITEENKEEEENK